MVRPVLRSEVDSNILNFLQNEFDIFDTTIWVNGTNKPYHLSTSNATWEELLSTSNDTLEELLNVYPSTYLPGTPLPITSALSRDQRNFEDYDYSDVSYQTLPIYLPDDEIIFTLPKTEASTAMTTSSTKVQTTMKTSLDETTSLDATTICVLET